MLDRLEFLLNEALIALRRNGFMTFAAVSTVAVSLFLLGGMYYTYLRAMEYANTIPGKFDMRVFLKDGTSMADITATATQIRALPGVKEAAWIPKDKAWAKEQLDHPQNTSGIDNPYPDMFKVTIADLKQAGAVADRIQALPTVSPASEGGVRYLREEEQIVQGGMQILRVLGLALGMLLFACGGILIYNAIRLTILSRRLEIRIMQLVGASRLTIQVPFIVEGIVQGIVGAAFAAGLLVISHGVLEKEVKEYLWPTTQFAPFPIVAMLMGLSLVGGVYGLICSLLAMRAPLKYR